MKIKLSTVYILVTFVFLVSLASSVKFSLLGIQETTYHVRFTFFFVVVVIHETITFERLVVACSARSVSSKAPASYCGGLKKNTYTNDQKNVRLKEKKYLSDGI